MLAEKLLRREGGLCVYGITPPKQATPPETVAEIARVQRERLATFGADGLVVYDIQDESDHNAQPRPFPFFPFEEVLDFAARKNLPVGVNVESVSIRKSEIEASAELFNRLKARLRRGR
jgi:hypothetical protein